MDAKSKAEFINSVASGQMIPCPVCGAQNVNDGLHRFCVQCGSPLRMPAAPAPAAEQAPAFSPVEEPKPAFQPVEEPAPKPADEPAPAFRPAPVRTAPAFQSSESKTAPAFQSSESKTAPAFQPVAQSAQSSEAGEPESAFASGLPAWDVVPPAVMVRRIK